MVSFLKSPQINQKNPEKYKFNLKKGPNLILVQKYLKSEEKIPKYGKKTIKKNTQNPDKTLKTQKNTQKIQKKVFT